MLSNIWNKILVVVAGFMAIVFAYWKVKSDGKKEGKAELKAETNEKVLNDIKKIKKPKNKDEVEKANEAYNRDNRK